MNWFPRKPRNQEPRAFSQQGLWRGADTTVFRSKVQSPCFQVSGKEGAYPLSGEAVALKEIWVLRGVGSGQPRALGPPSCPLKLPSRRSLWKASFSWILCCCIFPPWIWLGLAAGVPVDLLGRKLAESKERRILQLNVQRWPNSIQLFTSPAPNAPHPCSETVREPETAPRLPVHWLTGGLSLPWHKGTPLIILY